MFDTLDMGASGLIAQRTRVETISANIVNANTTHNAKGEPIPYRRKYVEFQPARMAHSDLPGVRVSDIKEDQGDFSRKFEPGNPDADKDGYVLYPNVDLSFEYVNALEASRAYEANVTMMDTTKSMISASLRLIA